MSFEQVPEGQSNIKRQEVDNMDKMPVLPDNWREWTIVEQIGEGSYGKVYLGEKTSD